jgi:hypothetical protein
MVMAILSLIAAVHRSIVLGYKESYMFYILFVISSLMYFLRNYMGKKKGKSN